MKNLIKKICNAMEVEEMTLKLLAEYWCLETDRKIQVVTGKITSAEFIFLRLQFEGRNEFSFVLPDGYN